MIWKHQSLPKEKQKMKAKPQNS